MELHNISMNTFSDQKVTHSEYIINSGSEDILLLFLLLGGLCQFTRLISHCETPLTSQMRWGGKSIDWVRLFCSPTCYKKYRVNTEQAGQKKFTNQDLPSKRSKGEWVLTAVLSMFRSSCITIIFSPLKII